MKVQYSYLLFPGKGYLYLCFFGVTKYIKINTVLKNKKIK